MAREMGTIVYKRPAKRVAEIVEDTWGGPRSDRGGGSATHSRVIALSRRTSPESECQSDTQRYKDTLIATGCGEGAAP